MHDHIMYYTSLNLMQYIYIIYNVYVYNNIYIYICTYYKYKTQEPNM